ncbi:hypothetical protein [Azospirillum sp. TSO22-1]|uniref:hypothetical protein n=1 Tax=Azospirillum sp. TSO22-1 TaxID=716789 RepID=UPI000D60BCB6|nr:hypothetical protein [Azospirillum sp. TSO22-1]PWC55797.1 hypothetical protein TSO221_03545 [Azospirillum sp. TSO22-1]
MLRVAAALVVGLGCGAALAQSAAGNPPVSEVVDPRTSPIAFGDPVYGGPRPNELRRLERGGMSTFTARWLREEGQTIVLYSRAGDGEFISKRTEPAEVRERFIPPGGSGRSFGGGATVGAGRVYAFERYEMTLSGNVYGCFVATSVTSGDLVLINQCRADPAVPPEADVAAALARLRVAPSPREPEAMALGGKRI